MTAIRAWRDITFTQWAWTTGIGLVFALAYVAGLLPPLLRLVPPVFGSQPPPLTLAQLLGFPISTLATAFCVLLAVSIAEHGAPDRVASLRRYIAAGACGCIAGVLAELVLFVTIPSIAPLRGGMALLTEPRRLIGGTLWSVMNLALSVGLALAVYVRFRLAQRARAAFNAIELERARACRELLASRLDTMRARVEPQFLLGTLAQVEALYDRDPQAGELMLDALIAYLHEVLPRLRSEQSMLQQEADLAASYLAVVKIRMGSRLDYRFDIPHELSDGEFPPMVLLPLIDDALRNGLEPLPHGGTITIAASSDNGTLRVRVLDDGMPPDTRAIPEGSLGLLRARLVGLYGPDADISIRPTETNGVVAVIEVPLVRARDHR